MRTSWEATTALYRWNLAYNLRISPIPFSERPAVRTNISKDWRQSLKTPLVAVCAVIAAIVLFVMWLGVVVVVTKTLIG